MAAEDFNGDDVPDMFWQKSFAMQLHGEILFWCGIGKAIMKRWILLVILAVSIRVGIADILNVNSGFYIYSTQSYDVKSSLSGAGPVVSQAFSAAETFTDPSQPDSLLNVNYEANASAAFGVLKGGIGGFFGGNPMFPLVSAYTASYFEDGLTFFTSASHGTAYLTFTIDGSGSGPNSQDFEGIHSDTWGGFYAGPMGVAHQTDFIDTTNTTVHVTMESEPIPFTSGLPVAIEASLGPAVSIICNIGILSPCDSWTASAESSFGDTATLTGIALFDENGAPIGSFSIQSESGTNYTADGVVPEPSVSVMIAVLVGILLLRAARRSRSC